MTQKEKRFANYKDERAVWATLASGEYYLDFLLSACEFKEEGNACIKDTYLPV